MVPLFAWIYFSDMPNANTWALTIFILAGITDILDGYIARRYNLITNIGIVLDPLADKLMLLTAILSLYIKNHMPLIVLVIMFAKEIFMIISGIYLYFRKDNIVIPSNIFGKLATVLFTIAIIISILSPDHWYATTAILIALLFKLIALSSYLRHYFTHVKTSS